MRDPVRGGGLILATACHALDMLYWLNESEPVRVYAESIPRVPEQGCNVTAATATIRFANGAIASLLLAEAGENSYVGKWLHQVFDGTRSAVLYDHFRQASFSGAAIAHFAAEDEVRADGTFGVMEDFVLSIRTGKPPAIGARDGLRATLMGRKMLDSIRTGRRRRSDSMSWKIDYLVLLVYLAATSAIGLPVRKGQTTGLSYFLGDRSIHWIPAGITMTAVSVSTITFIGMPGQAFKSDWTFLQLYMVLPLASWIVSVSFLPSTLDTTW